jgi:hypothetical protein
MKWFIFVIAISVFFSCNESKDKKKKNSSDDDKTIEESESGNEEKVFEKDVDNKEYKADQITAEPLSFCDKQKEIEEEFIPRTSDPEFLFESTVYNFESAIVEGEIVSHAFDFRNVGGSPLVIRNANASCGCTVPTYSTDSIAPGECGTVEIEFNSRGKGGLVKNSVTLYANTDPNIIKLKFTVEVIKD